MDERGTLHLVSSLDSAMIIRLKKDILIRDAIITNSKEIISEQSITIKNQKTLIESLKSNLKWIIVVVLVIFILGVGYKFYKWVKK